MWKKVTLLLLGNLPATSANVRAFVGYFIYRNNAIATVVNNPSTTSWTDTNLENGDYEYYLKAVYDAGISVESNHVNVNVNVLPDLFAPSNLQVFVENVTNVHLTWDIPADNVISYTIFKDNIELTTSEENSYWDNNLPNGSYTYYVKAVYPEGISSPSNSVVVNIESADTPNNLIATVSNENDVILTWENPNNNETGLIINRNGEEIAYLSDVSQEEYIDQNLANAQYTYTIRAIYNHQFSELSNPAYVDIMMIHTPQISTYQATDNNINITWEDLSPWGRLVDYTVYKNGEELINTDTNYYSESNLSNGIYDFTVRANFDFGSSEDSSPVNFQILLPQMVTNLTSNLLDGDLILSWDYPVDTGLITSYKVYRNNDEIATTQENVFTDIDLMNGNYSYQVMTYYNDNIDNPITNAIQVSNIQAHPITNLTTTIDGNSVAVTWDEPVDMFGFQHYKVFRNDVFIMNLYSGATGFNNTLPENGLYHYTNKISLSKWSSYRCCLRRYKLHYSCFSK